jgi:hypothetical protein
MYFIFAGLYNYAVSRKSIKFNLMDMSCFRRLPRRLRLLAMTPDQSGFYDPDGLYDTFVKKVLFLIYSSPTSDFQIKHHPGNRFRVVRTYI